ncbi:MAG: hypothetical protein AAF936_07510 [Pseudomonadota bacterium]
MIVRNFWCTLVVLGLLSCGEEAEQPEVEPASLQLPSGVDGDESKPLVLNEGLALLEEDETVFELQTARQQRPVFSRQFVVEGSRVFHGRLIATENLIFKPNSSLVFAYDELNYADEVRIIARKIVAESGDNPPLITYMKPSQLEPAMANGSGSTGLVGGGYGESGGPGGPGLDGAEGKRGADAPKLTLITMEFVGEPFVVDFSGATGAVGKAGQRGGDGGNGATGRPASQSAFDCKRGAGDGGDGGHGGPGGNGGKGGNGGRGGEVVVLAPFEQFGSLQDNVEYIVSGGKPRVGGRGGSGGNPGYGGRAGQEALPHCRRNGRNGRDGARGSDGVRGTEGELGEPGTIFIGLISQDHFTLLQN